MLLMIDNCDTSIGDIVYDFRPEYEWKETLSEARAMMRAAGAGGGA